MEPTHIDHAICQGLSCHLIVTVDEYVVVSTSFLRVRLVLCPWYVCVPFSLGKGEAYLGAIFGVPLGDVMDDLEPVLVSLYIFSEVPLAHLLLNLDIALDLTGHLVILIAWVFRVLVIDQINIWQLFFLALPGNDSCHI